MKLRSLITELRPAALDEIGLQPALQALAERSASRAGISIDAKLELNGHLDCPALETTVFRLVQEGLTNVARHAEAETVELEVRTDSETVSVLLRDDGVGFDPAEESTGFGLRGVRERVKLARGRIEVDSAPGSGTVIRAELPLGEPHRPTLGRSDLDQPAIDRVANELCAIREAELLLDVRAVRLDRADAEVELLGDLVVGVAQRDQAQNLQLTVGEVVGRRGLRLRREPRAQLGLKIGLADRRHSHRLDKLLAGRLLEDVGEDAGLQRLAGEGRLVLHGEDDDLGFGRLASNLGVSPRARTRRAC